MNIILLLKTICYICLTIFHKELNIIIYHYTQKLKNNKTNYCVASISFVRIYKSDISLGVGDWPASISYNLSTDPFFDDFSGSLLSNVTDDPRWPFLVGVGSRGRVEDGKNKGMTLLLAFGETHASP